MGIRRKQRQAPAQGKVEAAGSAALFLFPFDIYHNCSEPVVTAVRGSRVVVYPPFANEGRERPVRQVKLERVPFPKGTHPPHIRAPRLKGLQKSLSWSDKATPGNALRIDWYGKTPLNSAHWFVEPLLEALRAISMQWWIKKDRAADEGYLRNSFSIDANGQRLDGLAIMAKQYGWTRLERIIDPDMFRQAVQLTAEGRQAPFALLTFCDTYYSLGTGDFRRFLVEAAVTCETLLRSDIPRAARTAGVDAHVVDDFVSHRKFERMIDDVGRLVSGPVFDNPEEGSEWLKALWVARNHVAHGREPVIKLPGQAARPPQGGDYSAMCGALQSLLLAAGRTAEFQFSSG